MILMSSVKNERVIGVLGAFAAYLIWGLQPIYWKIFSALDAWLVIAHRYCWTTLVLLVFIILTGQWNSLLETVTELRRRHWHITILVIVSFIAVINWWINIFAPMSGHVVELGIGLFLTPLMSVMLGVIFFRERLNIIQKFSVILAVTGVAIMLIQFGNFPWIALGVSSTWAVYGALKKTIRLAPTVAIFLESIFIVPFALIFLAFADDAGFFAQLAELDVTAWALIGTGILTSVPLITYTYATNYLPLNVLGFCQYLSPILTLCLGVFIYGEHFGLKELFPMSFIWLSIALYLIGQRFHANFRFKGISANS